MSARTVQRGSVTDSGPCYRSTQIFCFFLGQFCDLVCFQEFVHFISFVGKQLFVVFSYHPFCVCQIGSDAQGHFWL